MVRVDVTESLSKVAESLVDFCRDESQELYETLLLRSLVFPALRVRFLNQAALLVGSQDVSHLVRVILEVDLVHLHWEEVEAVNKYRQLLH